MRIENLNGEYNVLNNTLKKEENVLITYNGIINNNALDFIKNVLFNDEKISNTDVIRYLKNKNDKMLCKLVLERKITNPIEWLFYKNEDLKKSLVDIIGDEWNRTYIGEITDFAKGLNNLFFGKFAKDITIVIDESDKGAITILQTLFDPKFMSNVIIEKTPGGKITKDLLMDKQYTLIINDDLDILYNNSDLLKGKSICIPYTGYNFTLEKDDNLIIEDEILISKHKFEFIAIEKGFNLSFFYPYNMIEEMFMEG